MKDRSPRPLLIGLAVLGGLVALFLARRRSSDSASPSAAGHPVVAAHGPAAPAKRTASPRGLQGLVVDDRQDISADGRPPDARREAVIRSGLGEIQEMQQMNKAVFDDAAKRWNAQPRVKELIAQWKEVEETWKTQDDEAKAAVVPRMEAMWKEALGLLRAEVEKSASEAAGVK
jgi:hypothetical protein